MGRAVGDDLVRSPRDRKPVRRLRVHPAPGAYGLVDGDARRIEQVLTNIISNAIKFTDWGMVRLQVETVWRDEAQMMIRFTVIDTGIGMTDDAASRVFESYEQEKKFRMSLLNERQFIFNLLLG